MTIYVVQSYSENSVRTQALFLDFVLVEGSPALCSSGSTQEVREVAKHSVCGWSNTGVVVCQFLIYLQLAQKLVGVQCA